MLADRYGSTIYATTFGYDDSNNVTSQSTGATVAALQAPTSTGLAIGPSLLTASYSPRRFLTGVSGSYGTLIANATHTIDGRPASMTYGDFAKTSASYSYDSRLRLSEMKVSRAASAFPGASGGYVPPPAAGSQNTLQTVLMDDVISPTPPGTSTRSRTTPPPSPDTSSAGSSCGTARPGNSRRRAPPAAGS